MLFAFRMLGMNNNRNVRGTNEFEVRTADIRIPIVVLAISCPLELYWALLRFLRVSWALLGSPGLFWAGLLGSPGVSWALLGSPVCISAVLATSCKNNTRNVRARN